ncbi:MAG: helix-turn-helix transcriptional regulator [Candidatus Aminicenantes bacterium]|nr:helix-turn-helix transcriptional regulator [Candidatus Aminicenantes bacterium]
MSRITGRFFQKKRLEKGWTLPDLVGRIKNWNLNKGCNRVIGFERGENDLDPEILQRLAEVLQIRAEEMECIRHEEEAAVKAAFAAWRARSGENQFYYRAMACVFVRQAIPGHLRTDDEVIAFARRFSRERRVIAWLYLGRRERLAMRDGEVTRRRPFTWKNFREPDFSIQIR